MGAEGGFVGEGVGGGEGGSKVGGEVAVEGSEVEEEVSYLITRVQAQVFLFFFAGRGSY